MGENNLFQKEKRIEFLIALVFVLIGGRYPKYYTL